MDVFDELDIHLDKYLTYTQFMAGALSPGQFKAEQNLEVIFRIWDLDGDGKLSAGDVSKFASCKFLFPLVK
jgi:Ca2+-binding EF-hand superfamily protein